MIENERFFAWLDGELEPAEAAEMDAKVKADPELARLAEEHRALGTQLRAAFDPIATMPVPQRFDAALRQSANVVDFEAAKRARSMRSLPIWTSLAATLAVGVFVGTMVPQRSSGPVEAKGGMIYAAGRLNKALDTQLASAPAGDVRIGLTFRGRAGEICRTFNEAEASGLACRSRGQWQIKGLFGAPEGQQADYRMAAGMDPNLAALVDSTMTGDAFDAAQERAELERHWK